MKALLPFLLSSLALAGCASTAPTPDAVMNLPSSEVFEAQHGAAVPAAIAYQNILERALQCWQRGDRVIEASSFNSAAGTARLSVKTRAGEISPALVLVVVTVSRETPQTSRLIGRSLVATPARIGDLQNLRLWAEGMRPPCAA
jgi:hypothetical protein